MKTEDELSGDDDQAPVTVDVAELAELDAAPPMPGAPVTEPPARSQWQLVLRRFLRHRLAVGSLLVLIVMYTVVIFAKQFAPFPLNPNPLPLLQANHGPSAAHWFGTDELGRDQTTRILFAGRISLIIGILVAVFSTAIGTIIGAFAGYFGGGVDQVLMRITDLFLIVPAIAIVAMAQKGLVGRDLPIIGRVSSSTLITIILSFLFWQVIARVVRGLFLSIK